MGFKNSVWASVMRIKGSGFRAAYQESSPMSNLLGIRTFPPPHVRWIDAVLLHRRPMNYTYFPGRMVQDVFFLAPTPQTLNHVIPKP